MKSQRSSQVVQMVLVIVLTIFAGTWALGMVTSGYEQARERSESAARLTKKLSSVCVGRFLLDLPEGAQVALGRARIDGFDIEIFDESHDAFQTRLAQREAQLQQIPDRSGGSHNLEAATVVKNENGIAGKIFVHGRAVTEGQSSDGLTFERYRYEGVAAEALVHAGGLSIDVSTDFYDPESVGNLERLVAQLVPNSESRIPSEPGFCLDRAYIQDPLTAAQREQIMMSASLPSRPDIEFRMILAAGTAPDKHGLLERAADSNARLTPDESRRVTRLRGRTRTINGLAGDELIEQFEEESGVTDYSFWWEVNGTENNVFIPHVVFDMTTSHGKGGQVATAISKNDALVLWDTVSSSIRLRPPVQANTIRRGKNAVQEGK